MVSRIFVAYDRTIILGARFRSPNRMSFFLHGRSGSPSPIKTSDFAMLRFSIAWSLSRSASDRDTIAKAKRAVDAKRSEERLAKKVHDMRRLRLT